MRYPDLIAVVVSGSLLFSPAALAGPVLDRVKAASSVTCAAEERPGFAETDETAETGTNKEEVITGLAVDLCRAVAVAVLGPQAKIVFTLLDSAKDFDAVRDGRQDLVFLTGGTLMAERLADKLLLGPPAYIEPVSLMVPATSFVQGPRDLKGQSVCFMIGTGAERAMEAAFERDGVAFERLGFQEDVEMRDAYNVGRCKAIAAEATFLAEVRQDGGVHDLKSRIVDAPLAIDPVFLATGLDDARWSAVATATLQSLEVGPAPPRSGWTGMGAAPLAEALTPLGFRAGWYAEVTAAVGSYDDLLRRNVGEGSRLNLAPGPNQPWPKGLMLVPTSP